MNQDEWNALELYTGAIANKYGKAWAIQIPLDFVVKFQLIDMIEVIL